MILQKKAEVLEKKIHHLKSQQQHIENKIVQQLHRVLKRHNGFSIPFPALVGGIIHVIERSKTDPHLMEAWNVSGEKFLQQRQKNTSKKQPKAKSNTSTTVPSYPTPTTKME
jgi:spermidine synthase